MNNTKNTLHQQLCLSEDIAIYIHNKRFYAYGNVLLDLETNKQIKLRKITKKYPLSKQLGLNDVSELNIYVDGKLVYDEAIGSYDVYIIIYVYDHLGYVKTRITPEDTTWFGTLGRLKLVQLHKKRSRTYKTIEHQQWLNEYNDFLPIYSDEITHEYLPHPFSNIEFVDDDLEYELEVDRYIGTIVDR